MGCPIEVSWLSELEMIRTLELMLVVAVAVAVSSVP